MSQTPIQNLPPGTLCEYIKVKHCLIVWSPARNLIEGIDEDDDWEGDAFTCDSKRTIILILSEPVKVRDNSCVPVLIGGHKAGWIFAGTLVKVIA